MMGEIVGLRGKMVTDGRTPEKPVVDALEGLLARARTGEIVGITIAYEYFDGATGCDTQGVVSYKMIGRIERSKLYILSQLDKCR
jgi:hypothetical protein